MGSEHLLVFLAGNGKMTFLFWLLRQPDVKLPLPRVAASTYANSETRALKDKIPFNSHTARCNQRESRLGICPVSIKSYSPSPSPLSDGPFFVSRLHDVFRRSKSDIPWNVTARATAWVGFAGVAAFSSSSSVQQQRIALPISVSAVLAIPFRVCFATIQKSTFRRAV